MSKKDFKIDYLDPKPFPELEYGVNSLFNKGYLDGRNIRIGSITTSQLNFTPTDSDNVIATINASSEGLTIDADNIAISGSTTFSSGYDPTDKVDELGGSYDSSASGARVRIFPDANTGIQVIDDGGNDVFKTIVGGTDIGDVIIGDTSSNKYLKWDKSEASLDLGSASTINGRVASTISGAINSSGNFINDVINSNLNTSTKTILSDFTFTDADYAGAFKTGDITWNTSGEVTGGSGILMNAKGLVGANSGSTTFSIDATTGNATFYGTLSAASGTLGTITLASGGNIKLGQTAYNTGTGFWLGDDSGTTKFSIGNSSSKHLRFDGSDFVLNEIDIISPTINTAIASDLSGDFTVTSGTETITSSSHGLYVDNKVTVSTTGTLPSPLSAGTYYVTARTTDTFEISSTRGGTSITFTDTGSGTHSWVRASVRDVKLSADDGLQIYDNACNRVQLYDYYIRLRDESGNESTKLYGDVTGGDKVTTIQTDYFVPYTNKSVDLGYFGNGFGDAYIDYGFFGSGLTTDGGIVLTPSSAPTAVEGRLYYDSSANKLKFYNGSTWETVSSS